MMISCRRSALLMSLSLSATLMMSLTAAEPIEANVNESANYHPDRLLVIFHQASNQANTVQTRQAKSAFQTRDLSLSLSHFEHLPQHALVHRPAGYSLDQTMQSLLERPEVYRVERDYRLRKTQQPNDSRYDQQWYLQALPGIQAEQAWQQTTGDPNIVVAVIDTGIDYNHDDLRDNIWRNPREEKNGQDDSGNGYIDDIHGINTANDTSDPMDDDGHGTLVAGIIAASGNNNVGIAGVNWQLQLLACKFLDEEGEGFTSDAIACLDYVLDLKVNHGIPIVASNNSWGSPQFTESLYQAVKAHHDAGILFVASAGNSSSALPFYPAAFDLPNVISVTAHDQQGKRANFANYGRQHVAISAPGVQMLSTFLDNQYATSSGTSMAGPVVAGMAALIKATQPGADVQRIKSSILVGASTATDPLLHNYIMTGNLALAADGAGAGALDCQNQQLIRRLAPENDIVYAEAGQFIDIKVMALNCHGAIKLPEIMVSGTMEALQLNDDGQADDAFAGDGMYAGRWYFSGTAAVLNFPDGAVQIAVRRPDYCSEVAVSEISLSQCNALVELYYQTSGPGWFERHGWLQSNTPCSWFGVQCQHSQVTALDLANNNLTGELGSTLGSLSALRRFDLSGNALSGVIPASVVNLTALQQLNLSQNNLTGTVPAAIHQLQNLQQLDLASNDFHGALPATLGQLTALQSLDLSTNLFRGSLPDSLVNLVVLTRFNYQETTLCEPRHAEYYQWLQAIPTLSVNEDCPNQAPVVSAGVAQTVSAGSAVTLQGAVSDADGEQLQLQWLQIAGPSVVLTHADTLQPRFISPSPLQTVTLRFRLRANDLRTSSDDIVNISVQVEPASSSSSGGAALWLWCIAMLIWIGRITADRVYSSVR